MQYGAGTGQLLEPVHLKHNPNAIQYTECKQQRCGIHAARLVVTSLGVWHVQRPGSVVCGSHLDRLIETPTQPISTTDKHSRPRDTRLWAPPGSLEK